MNDMSKTKLWLLVGALALGLSLSRLIFFGELFPNGKSLEMEKAKQKPPCCEKQE